ncbi:hypothetical protein FORC087_503 (plasmid) [Bacillus cereus]|nr:hypothetical protein FORC087_503 [Bacillus cereus]
MRLASKKQILLLEEFAGYGNRENDKKLVNYFPKKYMINLKRNGDKNLHSFLDR